MATRKDKKNRRLKDGECQREDGRYRFLYTENGVRKELGSWTLLPTDPTPKGKRPGKSLRELEDELELRLEEADMSGGKDITVGKLLDIFIDLKKPTIRKTTLRNYLSEKRRIETTGICEIKIQDLSLMDCKKWLIDLNERDLSYDTVKKTHSLLKLALEEAYENDWIKKNPCDFKISKVIGKSSSQERFPLNSFWEEKYLRYVRSSNTYSYYYRPIYVLLNTGLRISELCALTKKDINFQENYIRVTKQLLPGEDGNGRYIETTKTDNGIRKVPMTEEVKEIIREEIRRIRRRSANPSLGEYKNFIFISKSDTLMDSKCWGKVFRNIYGGFRKEYPEYEKQNDFSPISAHILRHTFCTNLVKAHVDAKSIISIVGHSSFATTFDIYTHYDFDTIAEDFHEKIG